MPDTRGAVMPIPALLAAAVVCLAVSLYATTLLDRSPGPERSIVEPATSDALERASDGGVVVPDRLDASVATVPGGYEANVSLRVGGRRWSAGPTPPVETDPAARDARTASRLVSVRVGSGRIRTGTFETVIWS
ncbi:hypothetical protein SAMN06269185_1995 [Natronoarchaeum philippinense]|uniref:Uncharacterized protein n=1 Tax=Natronoarchaeum philippinense TaxID=558529 RepID=A0A285NVB0_NATPI|nr:hypothetical protein [Natronoarchaeum philippinense]SNZ12957.1 hypothetical protein SAMN06269185_1995 [Natronoarchaeum philippinense]